MLKKNRLIPAYIGDRMVMRIKAGHGLISRAYEKIARIYRVKKIYYTATHDKMVVETK